MKRPDFDFMVSARSACLVDLPTGRPSQWCVESLQFDEAGNHGPFSLVGSEYTAEVIDDFGRTDITDEVLVWGSQTRKTGSLMGGVAWCLANDPCGILWVMPTQPLAKRFSRQRWQKLLRRSEGTRGLIPSGAMRHNFSTLEQILGATTINFAGSNSPANLSSNPCRRVILDEVDKFDDGGRAEADAVNLAEQRTKNQPNPQRWKTSTPTIVEGLIWQEYLKGDQRRYFVKCVHCSKEILLGWSKPFTALRLVGCESWVVWDKEAKRPDGSWDLDRVMRSARVECCHCGGHILDGHKTRMIRDGRWAPTATAASTFVSRQLSSLYATSQETSFGRLALKFLAMQNSLLGLQGFINGDLAEPYQSQDRQAERIELITSRVEVTAEWKKALTVDCQQRAPYFWYVARSWANGDSVGLAAGSAETWEDIRAVQQSHGISDCAVLVDSGFGAKSDAEVYKTCARFGEIVQRPQGLPICLGWMPTKGMPGRKRWKSPDSGLMVPYFLRPTDPYLGTSGAGLVEISLLEFSGDFYKDILENLRAGKAGAKWEVLESMASEEYWRHMDCEQKTAVFSKQTGRTQWVWLPRSKHWPNHLFDCEVIQVSGATFFGWLNIEEAA